MKYRCINQRYSYLKDVQFLLIVVCYFLMNGFRSGRRLSSVGFATRRREDAESVKKNVLQEQDSPL